MHCNATLTEFAVLALYGQAVSHPYMHGIHKTSGIMRMKLKNE